MRPTTDGAQLNGASQIDQTPHPQEWFYPNSPHPASPRGLTRARSFGPCGLSLRKLLSPFPKRLKSPAPASEGLIRWERRQLRSSPFLSSVSREPYEWF